MATRYAKANSELGAAYDPAAALINQQTSSIGDLYQQLVSGLSSQRGIAEQSILSAATRKGVDTTGLADQVGSALDQELLYGRAQLGASQAQSISDMASALAELKTSRVKEAQDSVGTRQELAQAIAKAKQDKKLDTAEYKLKLSELQKQYELDKLSAERSAELRKQAYAAQQAQYSSYGDGGYSNNGGGGGGGDVTAAAINDQALGYFNEMWAKKPYASRQEQDAWINNYFAQTGITSTKARQVVWNHINQVKNRPSNPTKDWLYAKKARYPAQGGGGGGW